MFLLSPFIVAASQGKNRRIHELKTIISEEHEKITSAFENEKLVHIEQHKELEKQIDLVRPLSCGTMYVILGNFFLCLFVL